MKVNYEQLIAEARAEIRDMKRIMQTCEPCMRDDAYEEIRDQLDKIKRYEYLMSLESPDAD